MATAPLNQPSSIVLGPIARPLTVADLAAMPTQLPSGPINYELDNGRLVLMSPTGGPHGNIQLAMGAELRMQGRKAGHGRAYVEVGVILWRNPDRVVAPDVCFVSARSLPLRKSSEGYLETIPELIVEVRSKNDTVAYVNQKIADYLQAGVQLVWIVDSETKTVTEHRRGLTTRTFTSADSLTCPGIITDFELSVGELFAE